MTEPLNNDLHWLGTHLPAFNQIADGTYITPENTPKGTQLLPLLKRPPEVVDQPTTILTATHKAGWLKAKGATALSKSGAYFGHYKTGTNHAISTTKCWRMATKEHASKEPNHPTISQ